MRAGKNGPKANAVNLSKTWPLVFLGVGFLYACCVLYLPLLIKPNKRKGTVQMDSFASEIQSGERFAFGRNWQRFLSTLNDERIAQSQNALKQKLGNLRGKKFLDIGSGSGLSSLVAHRLGALVHSFDYDPQSVACTQELRRRYGDIRWIVERGSALDRAYLERLGSFDVVYSWGVLHHTGNMWQALENVIPLVKSGGTLFIAIYNDQGKLSRFWRWAKRIYNSSAFGRAFIFLLCIPFLARIYFRAFTGKLKIDRGMSIWYDYLDWLGGYPFEVASYKAIVDFFQARGFTLKSEYVYVASGCNEFVFAHSAHARSP
jgi:2-polyprenyl-3-methyl-5-hydroxy-6-metoxy-1,4-benzoquinol methylase